jgi:hypothetical protein
MVDDLAAAAFRRLARAAKRELDDVGPLEPVQVYASALTGLVTMVVSVGQQSAIAEMMADAFDFAYADSVTGWPHPVHTATTKYMDRLGAATPAIAHLFIACAIGLAGVQPRSEAEQTFKTAHEAVLTAMGLS